MISFSSLNRPLKRFVISHSWKNGLQSRPMSSHRVFPFQPSRFQWTKFKDMVNLYFFVGAIPLGLVVAYAHIYIGPATLSEIQEGYTPQHWEYYRHPITRFFARYILNNPQQDYEKFLHYLFEAEEKRRLRKLEQQVRALMKERLDYKAYYYKPVLAKYHRKTKQIADYLDDISGD